MEEIMKPIKEEYDIKNMLLQVMIDNEGSDMYITVGTAPSIKIGGDIVKIDDGIENFTSEETQSFAESIITKEQKEMLLRDKNLDFSFSFSGRRFRTNVSFQLGHYMIIIRLLSQKIPNINDLNLPDIYKDVTKLGQGLIIITGPTGSGKTTTLSAMINYINENYNKHIITIEDPVEYIHTHKKSIIEHKEVGKDVPNYETALLGAMRQNPQVIMFGEMRTKKQMEMALTLSETGHVVFTTLHTRGAYQTITRILDSFTGPEKNQVQMQLADSLVAIFSQRLLKVKDGTGVKLAKEILVNNSAIANLVRENDLHQLPSAMQIGTKDGMQLLETDIIDFIKKGIISEEEGLKFSNNPKIIREAL